MGPVKDPAIQALMHTCGSPTPRCEQLVLVERVLSFEVGDVRGLSYRLSFHSYLVDHLLILLFCVDTRQRSRSTSILNMVVVGIVVIVPCMLAWVTTEITTQITTELTTGNTTGIVTGIVTGIMLQIITAQLSDSRESLLQLG